MDSVSLCCQCMKWFECYRLRSNRDEPPESGLGRRKGCSEAGASIILDIEVATTTKFNNPKNQTTRLPFLCQDSSNQSEIIYAVHSETLEVLGVWVGSGNGSLKLSTIGSTC